jgi:2'-5' RNA ligase superfamily
MCPDVVLERFSRRRCPGWSAIVGGAVTRLRPGTNLIVPVLDADPVVGAWLGIPKADFGGVSLQVTVMYPFPPARSVQQAGKQRIAGPAAGSAPLDFTITHLDTFPGVHYLAAEPAAPFVAITEAIQRRWPSCRPYGGTYDSVIPHVTVAFGADPPADLERTLPIVTRASELWLFGQTPPAGAPCGVLHRQPPQRPSTTPFRVRR